MNPARWAVAALVSVLLYNGAAGQCEPHWIVGPEQGLPGVNGEVYASCTWDPDGTGPQPAVLVAGGFFSIAGKCSANNIAAWDGSAWRPIGVGLEFSVRAITVHNGQLIAGGTQSGGTRCLARWNGSLWESLGGTVTAGIPEVQALAVYHGELYAAGRFKAIDGVNLGLIARWDGASWKPLVTGINGSFVGSLTVFNDKLIAGGFFGLAGGVSTGNAAAWNGSAWSSLGGGVSSQVNALAVFNGKLCAIGDGTQCVRFWNGSAWTSSSSVRGTGMSVAVFQNVLYVGGYLTTSTGATCGVCSMTESSGATARALLYARSLSVFGNVLIAGGYCKEVDEISPRGVASWDGAQWTPLGHGLNGSIASVVEYNGEIVAGGAFTGTGSERARGIARYAGGAWKSFNVGVYGPYFSVDRILVLGQRLFAGGVFTQAGGIEAPNIAEWDGTQWNALGDGLNGSVEAFAWFAGQLVVAGQFTASGGQPLNHIACWDGAQWHELGGGVSEYPWALCEWRGDLYVGGWLNEAGGTPVNGIARWDGVSWHPVGSWPDSDEREVFALTTWGGDLVVGGADVYSPQSSKAFVARWDGAAWNEVGGPFDPPGYVFALAAYRDDLVTGGWVRRAGDAEGSGLVRFDGSSWSIVGDGVDGEVDSLSVIHGDLFVGGYFATVGSECSPYWARWTDPTPAVTTHPFDSFTCGASSVTMSIEAVGDGPLRYQWLRDDQPVSDGQTLWGSTVHGATTPAITILGAAPGDAGAYTCAVSNGCGSALSKASRLAVCIADFDCNTFVNGEDFDTFGGLFERGDALADIDRNGRVNGDDFDLFVSAFVAGC